MVAKEVKVFVNHVLIISHGGSRLSVGRVQRVHLAGRFVNQGEHYIEGDAVLFLKSCRGGVHGIGEVAGKDLRVVQELAFFRVGFVHVSAQ